MSAVIELAPNSRLTAVELSRLAECEAVIKRGLDTFYAVGSALSEIRESRLYRKGYDTFEDYCQERWGMGRRHVNHLIEASGVVDNLGTTVPIPANERQARELSPLEPELQKAVWQIAVETAPKDKKGEPAITAAHIKSVASVVKGIVESGGLDDGSGEIKPLGVLVDAAVTEETYERLMRQKEYIRRDIEQIKAAEDATIKPHVSHNSGENEWYTPKEYIDAARAVLGVIQLDPASSKTANKTVKAKTYYTVQDNGLSKPWAGTVWMNPPYASELVAKFAAKLVEHVNELEVEEAIVLVNNATETAWFRALAGIASAIIFPNSRVKFIDQLGDAVGAPLQGQAVIYIGDKPQVFVDEFSKFGWAAWVK